MHVQCSKKWKAGKKHKREKCPLGASSLRRKPLSTFGCVCSVSLFVEHMVIFKSTCF